MGSRISEDLGAVFWVLHGVVASAVKLRRMEPTQLIVEFEGSVPGIADHRLSLHAFSKSLSCLLSALRRIASNILVDVEGEESHGSRGGRYAKQAASLDLQIVTRDGSLGVVHEIVFPSEPQLPLFDDLGRATVRTFMDAIEDESQGRRRNGLVFSYLKSLPPGLSMQRYLGVSGGIEIRSPVEISDVKFALIPPELPYLSEVTGRIIGLGFDDPRFEIRFSTPEKMTCSTTRELVDRAIQLRDSTVTALILEPTKRLLRLTEGVPSDSIRAENAVTDEVMFEKWAGLLERLAK
jgi:hypothetical protein